MNNITKDEREAAGKLAGGSETFELVGVSDFVTNEQSLQNPVRQTLYPLARVNATGALAPGRRVAAKGVLIPGSPSRINLTSVVPLDGSCQETVPKNSVHSTSVKPLSFASGIVTGRTFTDSGTVSVPRSVSIRTVPR